MSTEAVDKIKAAMGDLGIESQERVDHRWVEEGTGNTYRMIRLRWTNPNGDDREVAIKTPTNLVGHPGDDAKERLYRHMLSERGLWLEVLEKITTDYYGIHSVPKIEGTEVTRRAE